MSKQLANTTAAVHRIAAAVGVDVGIRSTHGKGREVVTTEDIGGGTSRSQQPQFDLLRKLERALPGLVEIASQSESLAATQTRRFEQINDRMTAQAEAVDRKLEAIEASMRLVAAIHTQGDQAMQRNQPADDEATTYVV